MSNINDQEIPQVITNDYRVTLYAVVRVPVDVRSALSHVDAIAKAQTATDLHVAFREGEYAEEVVGVLVDESGDSEYLRSRTYLPSEEAESGWAPDECDKPEQAARTVEVIDAEIAKLRAERVELLACRENAIRPGINDDIPVGEPGKLVTLDGVEIQGTNEMVPGTCRILRVSRKIDGTLDLDLDQSTLAWDGAMTAKNDRNEVEFVTVNGDFVPESLVKLVAVSE